MLENAVDGKLVHVSVSLQGDDLRLHVVTTPQAVDGTIQLAMTSTEGMLVLAGSTRDPSDGHYGDAVQLIVGI